MVFDDKPATLDRLDTEPIIWLTTVRGNGQPQTSPVWFLRQGNDMLIYSLPDTARVDNIRSNPRVALRMGHVRGVVLLAGALAGQAGQFFFWDDSIENQRSYVVRMPKAYPMYDSSYREAVAEICRRLVEGGFAVHRLVTESRRLEEAFLEQPLPVDIADELMAAVSPLLARGRVAVRSSATAEDMAIPFIASGAARRYYGG